ncbi:hypothetical protein [Hahella sp. HN01]|uniref:arsenate reductase/protein-tyrosine-phosphatase family protein n=1 Tax=unclassified Hahella TaxID=2624107 RepID=UPI001C1E8FAA|nr:hypothetical protein [Hahella sp. HN01]MBU6950598.1 hypothetical protein [Hahella sp. HN01]
MGKLKKLLKYMTEYLCMMVGLYKRYSNIPSGFSPKRIIFICKGNVCRSVYAEAYLKDILSKNDSSGRVEIISCGLATDGDTPANPTAKDVAANRGVNLQGHKSTRIQDVALRDSDLLVVMEPYMVKALQPYQKSGGESQIIILGMLGENRTPNIPDPYGKEVPVFNEVFDTIELKLAILQKSL